MSSAPEISLTTRQFVRGPTTIAELFEGPRLKIARAKKHVLDFKACADAFFKLNPVIIRPEKDAETGYLRTTLRLAQPVPGDLRLFAADALYNLRSCLDQAMSRCAVAAGKTPKSTYFPHGDDLAGFEAAMDRKCKKVPKAVREAVAALEPYYGGNGYLFRALHDLNVVDKHTDLIDVVVAVRRAEFAMQIGAPAGEVWRAIDDKFVPIAAADISASDIHQQIKFTLAVAFLDVKAVEHETATKVLGQLCDLVVQTIDVIETALLHALSTEEE